MALFRVKKNTEEKVDEKKQDSIQQDTAATTKKADTKTTVVEGVDYNRDISSVLLNVRVTEKATFANEKGAYVFDISPRATKRDVAEAIKALYKVTPRQVNIAKIPSKRVRVRSQRNAFGVKSGGKKAYVYLKKGDTIDSV